MTTVATLSLTGAMVSAGAQSNWAVIEKLPVGGIGGWDYLTVDSPSHRLFVPRSSHTLVLQSETGKTLGDIPNQKNAHGTAIVESAGRGFISDGGGEGSVLVFDLKTYATLGKIATMPDSDGIIYDPSLDLVLVVSGDKGTLMSFKPTIDLKSGKMDAPIELGGSPEFLASDGAGHVYVNLMDKNEVAVVDMKQRKVVKRWPVAPGGAPVGMAIDVKKKLLFLGCRNPQKLIVMSMEDGKVLSSIPIGVSVDAIEVDGDRVFASCRDGSLYMAQEKSHGHFELSQRLETMPGASTMGLDAARHRLYLPTAEYAPAAPGGKRGAPKPNSFTVLVVGAGAAK